MKYMFDYHGENENGHYFTIVTDDESGLRMVGIDVKFNHFILKPDGSVKRISYLEVPSFSEKPSEISKDAVRSLALSHFSGLIPYDTPFYDRITQK